MTHKKYGALSSSQNPDEIANKVKGTILAFSSVIIFLAAKVFGVNLQAADIVQLATILSGAAGAVWAVYGAFLHLVAFVAEKKAAQQS